MDAVDLAGIAIITLVCGLIGQLTSGYSRGGLIVNLFSAFAGAVAGVHISRAVHATDVFNYKTANSNFPILWALIGSVLLVAIVGTLVKPGRR
jgi:uncharacterized membrane protein YeaQ/YmgE (transglycosylase-associated protein family)